MAEEKIKILAVDDNESMREMLRDALELEGFDFYEAVDGFDAIKKAKKLMPHVILMDVRMPGMDGFEALKKIKEDPKTHNIAVIMLTFRNNDEDIAEAIKNYAEQYIPKPFEVEELVREIKKTLERRSAA